MEHAGSGDDVIFSAEPEFPLDKQQRDEVFCGPGEDIVYASRATVRI